MGIKGSLKLRGNDDVRLNYSQGKEEVGRLG